MMARRKWLQSGWSILACLVLAGCSSISSLNPFASSGPQPGPLPSVVEPVTLAPAFSVTLTAAPNRYLTPAVAGEVLIAAGGEGEVVAFGRQGETVWRTSVGAPIAAGIGSDGRLAAVVTDRGEVVALNVSDGSVRWRRPAGLFTLTPPVVLDGLVIVRAIDHRLLAFAALDGEPRWRYDRPLPPLSLRQSAPLVASGGALFVGYPGGVVAAIDPQRGQPIFELTVAPPKGTTEIERLTDIVGPVVLARNELCAAAYQGRVACFDLQNGQMVMSYPISSKVGIDRTLRSVVTVDENDRVVAIDLFSSALRWENGAFGYRQLTRPVVVGSLLLVGDRDGMVHALDGSDGRVRGRLSVASAPIVVPPLVLPDGRVAVQSQNGTLMVVEGVR